jgi:hypothetical protein
VLGWPRSQGQPQRTPWETREPLWIAKDDGVGLRCALSDGNAGEGLPHLRLSLCWPRMQLDGEGCQLLGWESAEVRFQQSLGLAHARIEIVVEAIEQPPTGGRFRGRGAADVVSYFVEFTIQPLERVAKDPQPMEKARALCPVSPRKKSAFKGSTVGRLLMCLPRPRGFRTRKQAIWRGAPREPRPPKPARAHKPALPETGERGPRPKRYSSWHTHSQRHTTELNT